MVKNKSDLFIVCGERSGDVHGSEIIKHLLIKKSSLKIHCWGGDEMKKSGGIILENYTSYNIMGFKEVNAKTGQVDVDLLKEGIIDPVKVTMSSLQSAVSIATLMIMTDVAIPLQKED